MHIVDECGLERLLIPKTKSEDSLIDDAQAHK
jgi:hypothetical protein